jgi:iron complex transport system ATP-binding protein
MGTMKTQAISAGALSFSYGSKTLFGNISFAVQENVFTVIMGQNGSGKSTLLRIMAGLLPYKKGSVTVFGEELRLLHPRNKAKLIGFLPQQHKPVFPFTVSEVVLTGRAAHIRYLPGAGDRAIAAAAIERTGIAHLAHRYYTELSGGEQQLVMIARTLAQQPRILLLDEPVSHLDYNNQLLIIKLLKELVREGITVAAVLHDPNLSFLFGAKFIFVHEGSVVADNSDHPWLNPLVKAIFYHPVAMVPHGNKQILIPEAYG